MSFRGAFFAGEIPQAYIENAIFLINLPDAADTDTPLGQHKASLPAARSYRNGLQSG
jgi:hypothetical protein